MIKSLLLTAALLLPMLNMAAEAPKRPYNATKLVALTPTLSSGEYIEFYEETGPCVNGAHLAIYHNPRAEQITPGCYIFVGGNAVQVAWLDGDTGQIPISVLKKPENT